MGVKFRGMLMLILTSFVATIVLAAVLTFVLHPMLSQVISSPALTAFLSCWLAVALIIAFDDKYIYPWTANLFKFIRSTVERWTSPGMGDD